MSDALIQLIDEAKSGSPLAQCHLGELYSEGESLPRDYQAAHYWLQRAARQGNQEARWRLVLLNQIRRS